MGRSLFGNDVRVYFAKDAKRDRVKIGCSSNVSRRLNRIDRRIVLMASMTGDRFTEQSLHDRFADERIGASEWFRLSDRLREFIVRVPVMEPEPIRRSGPMTAEEFFRIGLPGGSRSEAVVATRISAPTIFKAAHGGKLTVKVAKALQAWSLTVPERDGAWISAAKVLGIVEPKTA